MKKLITLCTMIMCSVQFSVAQRNSGPRYDSVYMPKDFIRPEQVLLIAAPAKTKRWVKDIDEAFANFKGKYEIPELGRSQLERTRHVDDLYPDKVKYPFLLVLTQEYGMNNMPEGVSAILYDRRDNDFVNFHTGKTSSKILDFVAEILIARAARVN